MHGYMENKLLQRIVVDPKILGGKPVIRGTRISIEVILKKLSQALKISNPWRESSFSI